MDGSLGFSISIVAVVVKGICFVCAMNGEVCERESKEKVEGMEVKEMKTRKKELSLGPKGPTRLNLSRSKGRC